MKTKTIEVKVERIIPAKVDEVYDAWLDRKVPGTPWSEGDRLLLNPKVDGFFYWLIHGTAHYGLFTKVERPSRIQHTWVSPYTMGEESKVTVTFKPKGDETRMTLVHSGLPNNSKGKAHERGWNYFLDKFPKHFGK
jgi:uncharacterized protein YndB with AHSA1/START domain